MIVEITGPAGSGKTTLSRTLSGYQNIQLGRRLNPKNVRNIPYFSRNLSWLLQMYVGQLRNGSWFTSREIQKMIYLKGWYRVLQRQATSKDAIVLLDQGPVFKLAALYGFGSHELKNKDFKPWWDGMFSLWASVLDVIVCLNASDENLIERIRHRDDWHRVKDVSVEEAASYLSKYRSSFEYVVSKLTANNSTKVIRFDTDQQSQDQILGKVLSAFEDQNNHS